MDVVHEEVAIIGMAGRFPGARNIQEFWENLQQGVESIRPFTDEELLASGVDEGMLEDPRFVNAGATMPDPDRFDAGFFGINAREAEVMDPQHRILLEIAWQALEDAGHDPDRFPGLIGVYGGVAPNTYFQNNIATRPDLIRLLGRYAIMLGSEKEYAITRISFKLNLRGPSVSVNTACSSSGVATHLACQSLLSGECDMALVGGGRIRVPLTGGYFYEEGGIMSPDGHCRAFDAEAQGTVAGSGMAMIVLRRLSDAIQDGDRVRAVIKGTAINNDGSQKIGFTAPSIQGQAAVIEEALTLTDVDPETIGYIEAHGTGTALGDPIEVAALTKAFRKWTPKIQFCSIGSVKSNIGHLDAGAGVAGIIKTVLALENNQIPASINFSAPNPEIDFRGSPFYVSAETTAWPRQDRPRRAGVSSFGLGGTNAHIILEEAPPQSATDSGRTHQLLLLSARSQGALSQADRALAQHLLDTPDQNLADIAFTLQTGRRAFQHRATVVCRDRNDAIGKLEALSERASYHQATAPSGNSIAFMFSGQGSQYVNMGLGLYEGEDTFRSDMNRSFDILRTETGLDLKGIIYPEAGRQAEASAQLSQTSITQPALFALEYAMAKQWMAWGLRPIALAGHSIGEYVAACLAGVLPVKEALILVYERGRLMQDLPQGSMLAVPLQEGDLQAYLNDGLSIAVINSPGMCVVSGEQDSIRLLESRLLKDGVEGRLLHTSHAFHSGMMEPILEPFANAMNGVQLSPPSIPFTSNVTGTWITREQATDPGYWSSHIRSTVRFADCLETLYGNGAQILLEVGPGRVLTTFANQHPARPEAGIALGSLRHPKQSSDDIAFLLESAGRLWAAGVEIDWEGFHRGFQRRRVSLPTYPFEGRRYWIQPGADIRLEPTTEDHASPSPQQALQIEERSLLASQPGEPRSDVERRLTSLWMDLLGVERVSIHDNFFEIGGSSLLATRLLTQIGRQFDQELPLSAIFEAPTIRGLAGLIEVEKPALTHSSLIKVKPGTTRPPLLCIPGNLGNVHHDLQYLSRHLGTELPVYGFQDGLGHPSNIRKLASHFIDDIRTSGLHPPYHLTGICSGSVVAFEMAQQLTREGEEVAFLALVEPASLPLPGARSYADLFAEIWFRFTRLVGADSTSIGNLNLGERLMFLRLRLKLIANLWEMKQYAPEIYPGMLHIYLTKESLTTSPRPRWRDFAAGETTLDEIPGTHRSITGDHAEIAEADMQVLANLILGRLETSY